MRPRFSFLVSLIAAVLLLSSGCSKASRSAKSLERAKTFEQKGEYERAEIEYLNAVRNAPDKKAPAVGLALLYYKQGAITRSIPFLRRAREIAPENLEVRVRFGLLLAAVGEKAKAREDAIYVLSKDPSNADAPFLLLDSSSSPEQVRDSIERIKALPNGADQKAPALTALALASLRTGDTQEGEALLNRALDADPKFDVALAAMTTLAGARGDFARAEEFAKRTTEAAAPYSSRVTVYPSFLLQRGNLPAARTALDQVISRMPSFLPPRLMMAELLAAQRSFDDALKLCTEVISRDPLHPDATLLRARIYQATGKLDKAGSELERLLSTFPTHAPALYQLGTVQLSAGDVGKAMATLGKATAADPNLLEASALMAETYLRQNDPGSALLILTDVLKRNPDYVRARMLLAEAFRMQGRFEDSRNVFLALERDFARDPQIPLIRGMMELQGRNLREARAAFERARELSKNGLAALDQLTTLDLGENKAADAIARVRTLIAGGREESELYILLGRSQQGAGQRAEAESSYRKAIALKPDNRTPYFLLARLYIDGKETDKALDNLRVVTEKNSKDTSALLLIGILLEQKKDFEGAKEAYEKILVANPKFGPALNNLAYLYAERFNRLEDAHEIATRARELAPNDPYAADTLGWILYRQGKYSWALSLIREASEKFPTSGEIQYHLGMVQYRLGDEISAREAFAKAVQLDPDFSGRDDAQTRLALLTTEASTDVELKRLLDENPDDPIALVRMGRFHLRHGAPQKAIEVYERMLKISPDSLVAIKGLAQAHLAAKDYAKATEAAQNARRIAKEDGEMAAVLGRAAWMTGDRRYAYSMLQEANRRLPKDTSISSDLAEAAFSQGRMAEYRTLLSKDIKPSSWAIEGSDKVNALMAKAAATKSLDDARKLLESALAVYPDYIPAMRELALRLADTTIDASRAYDWATRAREADASDKEIARALGLYSYRRGEFTRAASLLTEAVASSQDPHLFYILGKAQMQVKGANPKPAFQRALELGLSGQEKTETERLLK